MIVILTSIHCDTSVQMIDRFIEPHVKDGYIVSVSIVAKKNIETGEFQYNGLVEIMPDAAAAEVIKKTDWTQLKGRYVAIREYKVRNQQNDPRNRSDQSGEFNDKRLSDRRQSLYGQEFCFLENSYSVPVF